MPQAVLVALILTPLLHAEDALQQLQAKVQRIIKETEPSVACILVSRSSAYQELDPNFGTRTPGQLGGYSSENAKLDLSHPRYVPESYGSGVVIDESGLILTAAHVVTKATKIFVRLPGGKGSYANVYALDPRSDLAVLKLVARVPGLKPIKLGNADDVKKGQFIVTLSNPYAAGFLDGSPSASSGIVSNLRRRMPGHQSEAQRNKLMLHHFGTLIQIDARLNLGCSGGALLNLNGEMIGLLSAQAALTGVDTPGGFALPLNSGLRRIIDVLKQGKEVEYGFLAVQFDQFTTPPVKLGHVIPGGPAALGGLSNDDVVHSVGGMKVKTIDDLFLALGLHLAGDEVVIERSGNLGRIEKVTVKLGKSYLPRAIIASMRPPAIGGLRVDHATTLVQGFWGRRQVIPQAVRVREVVERSPADRAKMRVNDIITKVNGAPVKTPAEYERAIKKAGRIVTLTLLDDLGGQRDVKLTID